MIETKQEKHQLTITSNSIVSTQDNFSIYNIAAGDKYLPIEVYFQNKNGEKFYNSKTEKRIYNTTMTRLMFDIFIPDIVNLSPQERLNFPVCQYKKDGEIIRGIFPSEDDFLKYKNTIENLKYVYNNKEFWIYIWGIFSNVIFVQECLKRFADEGDKVVLTYKRNYEKVIEVEQHKNKYSNKLLESKNIIFRGAPGTGKSYLAKEIAADIISNGRTTDFNSLTEEQNKQIEFVQFHPSYDYSDFVEGLRPTTNLDGSMSFKLQDGVFKNFVAEAQTNFNSSKKTVSYSKVESSVQDTIMNFFSNVEFGETKFTTITTNTEKTFFISNVDEKNISIFAPENEKDKDIKISINGLQKMLESDKKFTTRKEASEFLHSISASNGVTYTWTLYNLIKSSKASKIKTDSEMLKPYIFIIDEINRGEISKIFGELFFAIDPGYRGKSGEVSTQYANLHENQNEKFSIPENVYIIGTMNDIDRSVDSFDFAMRRRFRFIEIKADERLEMLESLGSKIEEEAIRRMAALNNEIVNTEELNENYHIGASYFLKLEHLSFDQLWCDYLQPLLQEYVRGMYNETEIMKKFATAYGYRANQISND